MIREHEERANSVNKIKTVVYNTLKSNEKYKRLKKTEEPVVTDFDYFVNKGINTNIAESVLIEDINKTYDEVPEVTDLAYSPPTYNDVIGQSFYVDSTNFPNGLFLHSIDVYFSTKDSVSTVTLDVRKTVNGYPSSTEIIPFTTVVLSPDEVNIPTEGNSLPDPTTFIFDGPIYLEPGVYAFTLRSNSKDYNIFISERGKPSLIDNTLVVNPYIGVFFTSQQGDTWTAEQTKDMCFRIRRCLFKTGFHTYNFFTGTADLYFDGVLYKPLIKDFGDTTDITYNLTTFDIDVGIGSIESYQQPLEPFKEIYFTESRSLENANTNGCLIDVTMFTSSDHVSPILDLNGTSILMINNEVGHYSANIAASELLPNNGYALSKYISKTVTLQENFDSNGLSVYVDVNRPKGTDIEVYCKIQNTYDYSKSFDEQNWIRLPYISNSSRDKIITANELEYVEELYQNLDLTYSVEVDGETITYSDFNKFAIKIVFYSEDTITVPKIKNLRAIASL